MPFVTYLFIPANYPSKLLHTQSASKYQFVNLRFESNEPPKTYIAFVSESFISFFLPGTKRRNTEQEACIYQHHGIRRKHPAELMPVMHKHN